MISSIMPLEFHAPLAPVIAQAQGLIKSSLMARTLVRIATRAVTLDVVPERQRNLATRLNMLRNLHAAGILSSRNRRAATQLLAPGAPAPYANLVDQTGDTCHVAHAIHLCSLATERTSLDSRQRNCE